MRIYHRLNSILVFTMCCLQSNFAQPTAPEQKIPVFISSENSLFSEALAGMQSVADFEAEIFYVETLQAEHSDLGAWFRDTFSTKPPLVIAFGAAAVRFSKTYLPDIPVVFSMISAPKTMISSFSNSCGIGIDVPMSEFFATLKILKPDARNVVAFYTATGKEAAHEGIYHDLKHGLLYKPVLVEDSQNFAKYLENHKVDAILMIADPLYTRENFLLLSEFGLKNKIVTMTGFAPLVRTGATLGISPDYLHIGIQTGEMARRLLAQKSTCAQELIRFPGQTSFYVNQDYAAKQEIKIPDALLSRANTTRLFAAGVNLFNREKFKPALKIFNSILRQDPENKAAAIYYDKINTRLTGADIEKNLVLARRYLSEKKYSLARGQYQKALKINPKSAEARKGLEVSTREESAAYLLAGNLARKRGNNTEAMRKYLAAMRVLPDNKQAAAELSVVRSAERAKIPDMLRKADTHYNLRQYEQSVAYYSNILLIDPGHKRAREYQRLSILKKNAIDRLIHRKKNSLKQ